MNISEDIHRAVVEGDWSSIHAWLVQTQRDVNAPVDDHGTTLLMLVAEWANNRDDYVEGGAFRPGRSGSYVALAQELLALGANPNLSNPNNVTALHMVARGHGPETLAIVNLLLRHNADLPRPASSRRRSKRDRLEHPVVLECRGPVGLSE